MKHKLFLFIKTYLLFIVVFLIQKPLFMLFYHHIYQAASLKDYGSVLWHGLKLDASIAGYLTLLPGLILIASLWLRPQLIKITMKVYYGVISLLVSLVFVADMGLYKYWGFRLDSTPLFYLESPKNALASADVWTIAAGLAAIIASTLLLYDLFKRVLIKSAEKEPAVYIKKRSLAALYLLLLTGALLIPIRGGFSVATMNVGQVYFSSNMSLNHAAINPCFSLMESLSRESGFDKQFRFMDPAEADQEFTLLTEQSASDSIPTLFSTERPNVIFIVLESFMSKDLEVLGGVPQVAVRMNELSKEGILFTHFYANSFRTDRGLVSIFSGYPAQPTTSIMKYPRKSQTLPSIPLTLKKAGYTLQYYHGGDVDFTNMRSYLSSMGIESIIADRDFPLKERMSKWGAPDEFVFNRLSANLAEKQQEPFLKIIQTLSSHEPFEVPFHRLKDPYFNSVAYTDSCLGVFIDQYKQTPYWKNSIIVLVPDHAMGYPHNSDLLAAERYQIPLVLLGGAIKEPQVINTYASQIDLATTLLHQFQLPYHEFTFSKNMLNPASPQYAYFTFPVGFGMISDDNQLIFNNESRSTVIDNGKVPGLNLKKGQALLQKLYDDLEKR